MDEIEARSKSVSAAAIASRSAPGSTNPAPAAMQPSPILSESAAGCANPQRKPRVRKAGHADLSAHAAAASGAVPINDAVIMGHVIPDRRAAGTVTAGSTPEAAATPPGAAVASAPQLPALHCDGPSLHPSPLALASRDDGMLEGFKAAWQRLYSTEGVPDFLTAAADELRARHPGVPFLDHAWGQVRRTLHLHSMQ